MTTKKEEKVSKASNKKELKKIKKQEKKERKISKKKHLEEITKEKYKTTPRWKLTIYNFLTNKIFFNSVCLTLFIFIIEMLLRVIVGSPFNDFAVLRILISSIIIGTGFTWILHFFKRSIQRVVTAILMAITGIYAFVEFILYDMIGFFMGTGNADQGTKVTEYIKDIIRTMSFQRICLLLVTIILIVVYVLVDTYFSNRRRSYRFNIGQKIYINVVTLILIGSLCGLYYYTVRSENFQNKLQADSNYSLWLYPENSNLTVNNYGVVMYAFLDIKNQFTGITAEDILMLESKNNTKKKKEEDKITDYTRYIDNEAWNRLISNTNDSTLNTLNNYFINREVTSKNDMTGIFKGKNLIVILMESVNEISILNEEDFPTMYKMYHEGISFQNNYSPRNNCSTGNNEFTVLTSLWTINNTCTTNTYASHKYPEASFNIFNNAGYTTAAFHDYTQKFYRRSRILPNMGAMKYYGADELGVHYSTSYTEADDKEMYQLAKQYYMNSTPFMVYFATVTPHQSYVSSQTCSDRYYEKYKAKGYSSKLSRYLSKMQVFDEALAELLKELKDEGILDDTVIALFADHYPYGLYKEEINEYLNANNAGYTVNNNSTSDKNIDKTPMIIYNSATKPVEIKDYTTLIDLMPTLLNMFDMNYDPRLYLGTDVFSDSHVSRAYFSDKSWIDEVGFYYAPTNKMTYYGDTTYDSSVIASINKEISTRQSMSATAITNDYFKYLGNGLDKYKKQIEEEAAKQAESTTQAVS